MICVTFFEIFAIRPLSCSSEFIQQFIYRYSSNSPGTQNIQTAQACGVLEGEIKHALWHDAFQYHKFVFNSDFFVLSTMKRVLLSLYRSQFVDL